MLALIALNRLLFNRESSGKPVSEMGSDFSLFESMDVLADAPWEGVTTSDDKPASYVRLDRLKQGDIKKLTDVLDVLGIRYKMKHSSLIDKTSDGPPNVIAVEDPVDMRRIAALQGDRQHLGSLMAALDTPKNNPPPLAMSSPLREGDKVFPAQSPRGNPQGGADFFQDLLARSRELQNLFESGPHGHRVEPASAPVASSKAASPRFRDQESRDLYEKVMNNYQKDFNDPDSLTQRDAIRFVNHLQYGAFGTELQNRGLKALDQELKLRLYEVAAGAGDTQIKFYGLLGKRGLQISRKGDVRDTSEESVRTVSALSGALGLSDEFYNRTERTYEHFFSKENKVKLDTEWARQGNKGQFSEIMGRALSPSATSNTINVETKKNLVKFIVSQLNDVTGSSARLGFSSSIQTDGEASSTSIPLYGTALTLREGFVEEESLHDILDMVSHEYKHIMQKDLIDDFRAGKIGKDHPDYTAARVFSANDFSYIKIADDIEGYITQPVEQDAYLAGHKARALAEDAYVSPEEKSHYANNQPSWMKMGFSPS